MAVAAHNIAYLITAQERESRKEASNPIRKRLNKINEDVGGFVRFFVRTAP
jgi:hypothetical protein